VTEPGENEMTPGAGTPKHVRLNEWLGRIIAWHTEITSVIPRAVFVAEPDMEAE
jgi:hypothetical protein